MTAADRATLTRLLLDSVPLPPNGPATGTAVGALYVPRVLDAAEIGVLFRWLVARRRERPQ